MERKPFVGVDRFAVAPLTSDTTDALTYGTVTELEKSLVSAQYTPTAITGSFSASDQEIDTFSAKNGGALAIQIAGLTAQDEALLYGSRLDTTTNVVTSNKDDVIPQVMVIYSTKRSDGTYNLYKFPACKFSPQGETSTTITRSGVTYNAPQLSAQYIPTVHDGNDMYVKKAVAAGSAEVAAWFSSATGGLPAV